MRLKLPCLGQGQQRYKFIVEEPSGYALTKSETSTPPPRNGSPWAGLHNEQTRLMSAMISAVDPTVRIDVSLTLNFGGFLVDVPRRLGHHKALDAAANAFVAAFAWFRTGRATGFDALTFRLHGKALNALRLCLDDPITAHASETLCAIQLIMIYHVSISLLFPCLSQCLVYFDFEIELTTSFIVTPRQWPLHKPYARRRSHPQISWMCRSEEQLRRQDPPCTAGRAGTYCHEMSENFDFAFTY